MGSAVERGAMSPWVVCRLVPDAISAGTGGEEHVLRPSERAHGAHPSGPPGAAVGRERTPAATRLDAGLAVAIGVAFAYAVAFATLAIVKHLTFHSNAYDLGLQHHVVWNTAHGRWFEYTYMVAFNPGLVNHLGDHVNLILLPIAALYWLHDGPETLLVVQAALVASGFVPLFLVARRRLGSGGPALLLATLYLLHPGLQATLLFDFHPIALAAPLFLWAYHFADAHRGGWLAAATALLLATQENAGLVVALLGVLLLIERRRRAGAILLACGVAWFALCFFVVLPALNPGTGSNAFARYRHLGETWWQIALHLLAHPREAAASAFDAGGRAYLWSLLAPFGLVSLLAPEVLLCAASETALNLLSDFPAQRTIDYQYASVIVAVGALAAVVGTARAARFASARAGVDATRVAWGLAVWAVLASVVFQAHTYGNLRAAGREYAGAYADSAHARAGRRLLERIPPNDPVSAQGTVAPHVSRRPRVYVFPTVADAEWVILDETANPFPVHLLPVPGMTPEESYREYVRRLTAGGEFVASAQTDGWLLLHRVHTASPAAATRGAAPAAGDGAGGEDEGGR
jgi:uncharacterized membrane protein